MISVISLGIAPSFLFGDTSENEEPAPIFKRGMGLTMLTRKGFSGSSKQHSLEYLIQVEKEGNIGILKLKILKKYNVRIIYPTDEKIGKMLWKCHLCPQI